MGRSRLDVGRVVTDRQQTRVELRVQRLHAAVHDLREARQVGDRAHAQPRIGQLPRGPASRNQLDTEFCQSARELDDPGLVGYGKQRPGDLHLTGRRGLKRLLGVGSGCHMARLYRSGGARP